MSGLHKGFGADDAVVWSLNCVDTQVFLELVTYSTFDWSVQSTPQEDKKKSRKVIVMLYRQDNVAVVIMQPYFLY